RAIVSLRDIMDKSDGVSATGQSTHIPDLTRLGQNKAPKRLLFMWAAEKSTAINLANSYEDALREHNKLLGKEAEKQKAEDDQLAANDDPVKESQRPPRKLHTRLSKRRRSSLCNSCS